MNHVLTAILLLLSLALGGCTSSLDGTYKADFATMSAEMSDIAGFAQLEAQITLTGESTLLEVKALGAKDSVKGRLCKQGDQLRVSAKHDPCQQAELIFVQQADGNLYCTSCAETAFAPVWRRVNSK